MASMTRCGTCVPPGPSRKTAGWALTVWARAGNWARMWVRSRAVGAVSVVGIVSNVSSNIPNDSLDRVRTRLRSSALDDFDLRRKCRNHVDKVVEADDFVVLKWLEVPARIA